MTTLTSQRTWDESAAVYANFTSPGSIYDGSAEALVQMSAIEASDSVVDLACGTGIVTNHILRLPFASSLRITAVDFSPEMLSHARSRISAPNVSFSCTRAERFADVLTSRIDRLICNAAIWHFDMSAVLSAARDALAPHGVFAFSIPDDVLRPRSLDSWRADNPVIWRLLQRLGEDRPVPPVSMGGSGAPSPLAQKVHAAGFRVRRAAQLETPITADRYLDFAEIPIMLDRLGTVSGPARLREAISEVREEIRDRPPAVPPVRWLLMALEHRP